MCGLFLKEGTVDMIKDTLVDGFANAPHRSLYHALGLTKEEYVKSERSMKYVTIT